MSDRSMVRRSINEAILSNHLDELYKKAGDSSDGALQLYAGELGIFGIYYGHKVDPNKKAKFERARKYYNEKYNK